MSMFAAVFDLVSGRWVVVNEETLSALSEHETEEQARAACRRYTEREKRRRAINPFLHLSARAI